MILFANILVVVAFVSLLVWVPLWGIALSRFRSRLLTVDPELYHSAGFDTISMLMIGGGGPPLAQQFLNAGGYRSHADDEVRRYGDRLVSLRWLVVLPFALLVINLVIRLAFS